MKRPLTQRELPVARRVAKIASEEGLAEVSNEAVSLITRAMEDRIAGILASCTPSVVPPRRSSTILAQRGQQQQQQQALATAPLLVSGPPSSGLLSTGNPRIIAGPDAWQWVQTQKNIVLITLRDLKTLAEVNPAALRSPSVLLP
jgi:hypothetical protein